MLCSYFFFYRLYVRILKINTSPDEDEEDSREYLKSKRLKDMLEWDNRLLIKDFVILNGTYNYWNILHNHYSSICTNKND